MYQTRKDYMISALEKELVLLSNKARYIKEILDDTIDLRKKTKAVVCKMLQDKGYIIIDNDADYKYLVKMAIDSVTEENVDKLYKESTNKQNELELVKTTTIQQMWHSELDKLLEQYIEYKEDRERSNNFIVKKPRIGTKGKVLKKSKSASLVIVD